MSSHKRINMPESPFIFDARDEQATAALGRALAEALPSGATIALVGTLGAGKTRLVQALATAYGVDPRDAVSPTFVLVQEYHGTRTIYHLDAYRLRNDGEFLALGVDEYFAGDDLVVIEWADRVQRCLPPERLEIAIDVTGPTERRFTLTAHGERLLAAVAKVIRAISGWAA